MNREKIEDVLLKMGVPAGIKGFNYIADAVEYIDKNGANISVTQQLYPHIAEQRNSTAARVERAIRHAFQITRNDGDHEVVEKYIGFMHCQNFNSIVMLHKKLKQEEQEPLETPKTESGMVTGQQEIKRDFVNRKHL